MPADTGNTLAEDPFAGSCSLSRLASARHAHNVEAKISDCVQIGDHAESIQYIPLHNRTLRYLLAQNAQ